MLGVGDWANGWPVIAGAITAEFAAIEDRYQRELVGKGCVSLAWGKCGATGDPDVVGFVGDTDA